MTTPTTVQVRLQLRADTAANWTSVNPTLLNGELGLETNTNKIKIGDGSTAWNSLAYFPFVVSGGTVTGNLEIGTTGTLTFEGSTADGFETTLAVTNPTADRTITLPNQSGTVIVSGNASIVNADISATAEIAVSKLADGAARQVLQTDSAGTGVEWTDSLDLPGTLDVTSTATFDGVISASAGAASTPSITFTGDLNTGLYSPGADQFAISTAGTGRLFVDSTGRVGINTSSPTQLLHIYDGAFQAQAATDNTNTDISLIRAVAGPTGGAVFNIRAADGANDNSDWLITTNANESLRFNVGGSERVRIASDGKVGIGTTAPGSALSVGQTTAQTGTTAPVAFSILRSDSTTTLLSMGPHEAAQSSVSPGAVITSNNRGLIISNNTADLSGVSAEGIFLDRAGAALRFYNGGERARIDSSGRLLVGTSTSIDTRNYTNSNYNGPYIQQHGVTQGSSALAIYNWNSTAPNASPASIALNKSVGGTVGTRGALTVVNQDIGSINFNGDDGTNFIPAAVILAEVDGTPGTDDMPGRIVLSTTPDGSATPTERLRITSSGKIGLGTTAPAATAHISGNTIVSKVDLANASYDSVSFSVATEEITPNGLFFSPDGRKMFVNGATGDDVNEYTLSTPWVISSATYVTAFSTSAQETSPQCIFFRSDGLKMYIVGNTNDIIYQYALTTPWSVATASYESKSYSVATQETQPSGIFFKPNGLAMYVIGFFTDAIYQYTLSTAWDVSTATFVQSFSVASQETGPNDLSFTNDGTNMFVLGTSGDDVTIYTLTTPWDISTAAHVTQFSVSTQETTPAGLYVKPDGTKFYIVGTINDTVYQYTIPSAEIDLTGTTSINGDATIAQDLTVRGGIAGSEIKLLTTGADLTRTEALRITNDKVIAYNQGAPTAVNTTATLTVANLKTGIITSTSAAATDMTLPTGTLTEGGFSGIYTNMTFEWSVINTGPSLVRVLAGTDHTIVGSGSVATGTSGRFASRRTAANTFVTYRLV